MSDRLHLCNVFSDFMVFGACFPWEWREFVVRACSKVVFVALLLKHS